MTTFVDLPAGHPLWSEALPVLQELRPELTAEQLEQVLAEGTPQGLRFTAAVDDGAVRAVAGWRVLANTHALRKLYVDDLSTAADARSRGYGSALLGELARRGRALGCTRLDLDSGVQRFDAHRFYLRERLHISSHHFVLPLD
ncbi:GNAT family N-acetyltransferase [Cellulomonas taurus]|jgi:GNAT superfamily N-acetyltransferase|uniref:GNAT family N-acetyltransferase n=1 Tax=Cellulomonas taurus TaxID=2729175 RepID=UPI00145E93A9|nr:GNAT family N-acetyltransferase [Cellulomonas taurus]